MIHLDGLTQRQVELLDAIWEMDTQSEVNEFLETLDEVDKQNCQILMRMLILGLIDQSVDELPAYRDAAKVLEKYRLT
jgi:hypothetical protein